MPDTRTVPVTDTNPHECTDGHDCDHHEAPPDAVRGSSAPDRAPADLELRGDAPVRCRRDRAAADVPERFLFDVEVQSTLGFWAVRATGVVSPRLTRPARLRGWFGGHPMGPGAAGDMVALFTALAVGMLVAAACVSDGR